MKSSVAMLRAAVLSYTPRSREFARRALRSLGCAPLIFSSLDELEAMGERSASLDLLLLGDVPDVDSQGRMALAGAMAVVGPEVPVLHAPLAKRPRARSRGPGANEVQLASPRYFGELYAAILDFMPCDRLEGTPEGLVWDAYAFHPRERIVAFGNDEVRLDPVTFDVALELFFNAGQPLSRKWLKRMLPSGEHGAHWHSIDNLGVTIDDLCVAIRLDGTHGWQLDRPSAESYRLRRANLPVAPRRSSDAKAVVALPAAV